MNSQRIIAVVILVVGIVLLVVGLNASHSIADQASDFWAGRFTQATTWYIIGGIGATVLGVLMLAFGGHWSGTRK